jgi:hypothetical protein
MRLRWTLALALMLAATPGARVALDAAPAATGENGVACPPDWVVICHTRPRHPVRQHTKSIPLWALPWHLRHGDPLGACGAANQPPLANAGPDQTAPIAATVTLDASGSTDGDGDALTFLWTFLTQPAGSGAWLSDPTAVNPTSVVDEPGTYVLQLIVHDGEAASPPDTVQVSTVNSRPVADAGADASVPFGQTATHFLAARTRLAKRIR